MLDGSQLPIEGHGRVSRSAWTRSRGRMRPRSPRDKRGNASLKHSPHTRSRPDREPWRVALEPDTCEFVPSRKSARAVVSRSTSASASRRRSTDFVVMFFLPGEHKPRDVSFVVERIRCADIRVCRRDPRAESGEQALFAGAGRDQVKRVHGVALPDAIDAANALLEAHRVPGQLQIDDQSAPLMQVESFRCRIRREQQPALAGSE